MKSHCKNLILGYPKTNFLSRLVLGYPGISHSSGYPGISRYKSGYGRPGRRFSRCQLRLRLNRKLAGPQCRPRPGGPRHGPGGPRHGHWHCVSDSEATAVLIAGSCPAEGIRGNPPARSSYRHSGAPGGSDTVQCRDS